MAVPDQAELAAPLADGPVGLRSQQVVTPDGVVHSIVVLDGATIASVGPAPPRIPVIDVGPAWRRPRPSG